jgi:hypothetical protein
LTINYNAQTGGFFTDAATLNFENSYETTVVITDIINPENLAFVKLSLEMEIERYRDIDMINEPTFHSIVYHDTTGDLIITWNPILGAEEYDLEWQYQDNVKLEDESPSISNIPVDFMDNGTRVSVKQNYYRVSNIFDVGYFICRVRATTKSGKHFQHRIEGPWSNKDFNSNLLHATAPKYVVNKDYYQITGSIVHEDSLNWQLITSFAEQGLKKEVVTYMDGLFRGRQTVTRNNTDTMAIVGDFYYDHQNRQTIAVLPVPAFDKILKYHLNFNKVSGKDTILRPKDYLKDAAFCTLPNPKLDSSSGAGRYYSSTNPLISNSMNSNFGNNQYIPHAFGYPYTKTEYYPDPTNRVRRQGGVGSTHQIGGGHETQYIYATAYAEELDPLFGNDIGYSIHYQKQMVIDPNGQVSISYTNLAGKTIATALAGKNTSVTTALSSLDSSLTVFNLLSHNDSVYAENTLSTIQELAVEKAGYHYFNYKVNSGRYENECSGEICYDCVYDLSISVQNECGEELMDGNSITPGIQPLVVRIGKKLSELEIECEEGTVGFDFNIKTDSIPDSIAINLPVGKYTIQKKLVINLQAAEMYADSMLKYDTCKKTIDNYRSDILAGMDTWGCDLNCDKCATELGTLKNFMQKEKWRLYNDSSFTVTDFDSLYYQTIYQARKDICSTMCSTFSPCDGIYKMLEMDVSESGQYPGIAISSHPEYCHYLNCINQDSGKLYDANMVAIQTFDEAETAGFLDPLNDPAVAYSNINPDPYFTSSGASSKNAMSDYLNNIPDLTGTGTGFSAWELSALTVKGNHLSDAGQITTFLTNNVMGSADCGDMNDLMWRTFRAVYLQKKTSLYEHNQNVCYTSDLGVGKRRLFIKTGQIIDSLTEGHSDATATFNDGMDKSCDSNCLFQVNNWLEDMQDCDFGDSATRDSVIKALVKVCKYGCDDRNPFGASTVDLSKYHTAKYRTFGDVFRGFGIYESAICDTNLLSNLLPFNQTNHFLQNDTACCDCDFDTCTNRLKNSAYKKLIKYALRQKQDTACRECKECNEIAKGVNAFKKLYPNIEVLKNSNFPVLFQNYLNQLFQFNLSYREYIDYMEICIEVQDSLYNDSLIYTYFYNHYNPIGFVKPFGYASNINFKSKGRNPFDFKQPSQQYASQSAMLLEIDGLIHLDTCHCKTIFEYVDHASFTKTSGYSDEEIDLIMDAVDSLEGCTFTNKYAVFKTCLAAAGRDTSFLNSPIGLFETTTWNADQLEFLRDAVERDQELGLDSLIDLEGNCDCDGGGGSGTSIDTIPYVGISFHMEPFGIESCDTLGKWINQFMKRQSDITPDTKITELLNDWSMQLKFAKFIDSCYLKRMYDRNINYGAFNKADSNALTYHILNLFDKYLKCEGKGLNPAPHDMPGCCYRQGKFADLFLNYLCQMSKPYAGSNYLSMKDIQLYSNGIETYYETEMYNGVHKTSLHQVRNSRLYKWYRQFKVTDDVAHDFYFELSFIQASDKYHFGDILHFFDIVVLKNGCSSGSNQFMVKAIVKGAFPKLDTVLLYGTVSNVNMLQGCRPVLCNRQINEIEFKPDSCHKAYENMATYYAKLFYDRYVDSLKQDFINAYIAKCKNHARQTEEFTVEFKRSVYHYTLYYYDQLGNLIQTVPPAGVVTLTGVALDSVKAAREKRNRTPYYPAHTLITRYNYNTLNQLVWQSTPDAGESNFWYDRLGRLVSSQNAQQISTNSAHPTKRYSYTLYDSLGRIKEVGELTNSTAMTNTLAYDYNGFVSWVGSGGRTQITRTYYDRVKFGEGRTGFVQENLRSRVTSISVQQAEDTAYDEAVHYSYDIHGNVKSMVRENKQLKDFNHHLKQMDYDYDLISGKVNKVVYQKNKVDQFIHSYTYDAENRIKTANTSTDNVHFETDARYTYYKHGPLARTEIGRLYVQGVDYIYTLQGWLKGVNNTTLSTSRDPNKDGHTSGGNKYVSRDEYGFSLRYFKGDYKPINLSIYEGTSYFDIKQTGKSVADASPELFNGNISNMVTGIRKLAEPTLARAFKYDQLNRIKEAFSFTNPDSTNNQWGTSQASDSSWYESFSYDANGNITRLKRKGNKSSLYMMGNFSYNYQSGTNKLTSVDDQVSNSNYTIDIDDQSSNNYKYDHIGNLTVDVAEGIDSIQWNVYGKIKSITRTDPFYEDSLKANLNFSYTPDGHRSTKGVSIYQQETEYTYYVRDAQGNVMATYDLKNGKILDSSQLNITNINAQLVEIIDVQTFADFATDVLEIQNVGGFPTAYKSEIITQSLTEEVLILFDPVPYILYNTSIQTDVLANYTNTTILQSLSNHLGFSTFYNTIMPGACANAQILSLFVGFSGSGTFLSNWNAYNSDVVAMGNSYASWLVTNGYSIPPPVTCVTLLNVQNLVASKSISYFCQFLAVGTYSTSVKNTYYNQ